MHPLLMSMRADLALVEVHHFPAYTSAPQHSPGLDAYASMISARNMLWSWLSSLVIIRVIKLYFTLILIDPHHNYACYL